MKVLSTLLLFLICVKGQGVGLISYDAKEYYDTTIDGSDGLQTNTFTRIYGTQGAASSTWGTEIAGGSVVCYSGLGCANPTLSDSSSTVTKKWVIDGAFGAFVKDNSMGNGDECYGNGYMSCAGVESSDVGSALYGGFKCYGMGSCAYRKVQHYANYNSDYGGLYDRLYSTLAGYNSEWRTAANGNNYYMYVRGTFAGYGASYNCARGDNCTVDCDDSPFACYNMEYNCDNDAMCFLSGCNSANRIYCPTLTGSGSIINLDGLSADEYDYDITRDDNYDNIEAFASYMIDEFLMTSDDLESLDIGSYYDDMCYINCENNRDGDSETWDNAGEGTECTLNGARSDICFTAHESGRSGDFNLRDLGDNFDIYVDGDDSVDTTSISGVGAWTKIQCRADQTCQDMVIEDGGSELNCLGSDSCMWAVTNNVPVIRSFTWESAYDGQFDNVQIAMGFEEGSFDYASITTPGDESDCTLVLSAGKWTAYDLTYTCSSSDRCHIYWYGDSEFSQSNGNVNFECNGLCTFYDNDYSWVSDSSVTSPVEGSRSSGSSSGNNSDETGEIIWIAVVIVCVVVLVIVGIAIYFKKYRRNKDQQVGLLDEDAANAKAYEPVTMGGTS